MILSPFFVGVFVALGDKKGSVSGGAHIPHTDTGGCMLQQLPMALALE